MGRPEARTILLSEDLMPKILQQVAASDAARLEATCSELRRFVRAYRLHCGIFKPRLLVCSSGNSKVVELDWSTGKVLNVGSSAPPVRHTTNFSRTRSQRPCSPWSTGLALSPYDQHLYVCQYKIQGVVKLHGTTLKYLKTFARGVPAPEGIAFAHQSVYIVSAAGYLYRLNLDGKVMGQYELDIYQKPPRDLVPWSVILGPCNKLYITVDHAYESKDYTEPPRVAQSQELIRTGCVVEMELEESGEPKEETPRRLMACVDGQPAESGLVRPSGLCFTPKGQLLVTSMDGKIYWLQNSSVQECGVAKELILDCDLEGLPWDVKGKHGLARPPSRDS